MNTSDIIQYVLQLLAAVPTFIQQGEDAVTFINKQRELVAQMDAEGRGPTPQEWDELNQYIATQRQRLHSDGG